MVTVFWQNTDSNRLTNDFENIQTGKKQNKMVGIQYYSSRIHQTHMDPGPSWCPYVTSHQGLWESPSSRKFSEVHMLPPGGLCRGPWPGAVLKEENHLEIRVPSEIRGHSRRTLRRSLCCGLKLVFCGDSPTSNLAHKQAMLSLWRPQSLALGWDSWSPGSSVTSLDVLLFGTGWGPWAWEVLSTCSQCCYWILSSFQLWIRCFMPSLSKKRTKNVLPCVLIHTPNALCFPFRNLIIYWQ